MGLVQFQVQVPGAGPDGGGQSACSDNLRMAPMALHCTGLYTATKGMFYNGRDEVP